MSKIYIFIVSWSHPADSTRVAQKLKCQGCHRRKRNVSVDDILQTSFIFAFFRKYSTYFKLLKIHIKTRGVVYIFFLLKKLRQRLRLIFTLKVSKTCLYVVRKIKILSEYYITVLVLWNQHWNFGGELAKVWGRVC